MTPELSQCVSVVRQCDQTLQMLIPTLERQDQVIKKLNVDIGDYEQTILKLQERRWYENPFVMGTLGALAGVIAIESAR